MTCLTRFGRVFGGLRRRLLPIWSSVLARWIGLAAMAVTMAHRDGMVYDRHLLDALAVWLLATGIIIYRGGLGTGGANASVKG